MPAREAKITQTELTRYLKAYLNAGIPIERTEICEDGKVIIFSQNVGEPQTRNEWDES